MESVELFWWGINNNFISRIPYAYSNPFICALWNDTQCPSFTETGFPFWIYMVTLMVMGPVTSLTQGLVVSMVTGEWRRKGIRNKFFRRERYITVAVLFFTAPFMAVSYKLALEGYYGQVYHSLADRSVVTILLQVVAFNFMADTWFYFTHRMFHEVEWLYKSSHYLHHSAHPVNTFMGNGGDALELITQGEMQIFFPPIFVPIHISVFILNAMFMQGYVLFLHCGERIRMPYHPLIIDPYEHNIHHHFGMRNFNFGLYFTFWDRLLGTHKSVLPSFEKEKALAKANKQDTTSTSSSTSSSSTSSSTSTSSTSSKESNNSSSPPKEASPAQAEQEKWGHRRRTSHEDSFSDLVYYTVLNCLDVQPALRNLAKCFGLAAR